MGWAHGSTGGLFSEACEHGLLIGAQGVDRADMLWHAVAQQEGRALAFIVAEIRPVLRIRSEEHTSELQSLMRISYAVFCLKKKTQNKQLLCNQYAIV